MPEPGTADMDAIFAQVWGEGLRPYPFQQKVTQLLAEGRRVVLQAPTGAGKTWAALTAYLHSRSEQASLAMPAKCLYAVPMRVLATQFYAAHHAPSASVGIRATIQTGETQEDRRLTGDLVFLTIDQLLSSFLTMPYSLPMRLANLNAGAIVGAYVVLDEFHLFDPSSTLKTALDMLSRLRGLAPLLVMTATFSSAMLGELATLLDAEVVVTPPDEVRDIETQWGERPPRQRTWRTADVPLETEAILAAHVPGTRTLVVCNQVGRAQDLFAELRRRHPRVVLLHSRFLPQDRRRWEDELRAEFGRAGNADIIAVATQVVEVGLDISAQTLHTELAPAAALIQRAGRCARYPGEAGTVWVYPTESARPYAARRDDPVALEMQETFTWLQEHSGQVLTFDDEQALVDAVCTERDWRILEGLRASAAMARSEVDRALAGDRGARVGTRLVRDADSRRLLIHSEPDVLLGSPFAAEGFSVHPSVLAGALTNWRQQAAELGLPWTAKCLADAGDEEEAGHSRYEWREVNNPREFLGSGMVVVHSALAGYDPACGLLLHENTGFVSGLPQRTTEEERYSTSYRVEPYRMHVQHVVRALERGFAEALGRPATVLERLAGWQGGSLARAAWLVCALHDVGKLSTGWQRWAHCYQSAIGQPIAEPVAHTCFDGANPHHREAQQGLGARPNHAGEGAFAVLPILAGALEGNEALTRAALSAIARHHGPFTQGFQPFTLVREARQQVSASLREVPAPVRAGLDARQLSLEGDPRDLPFDLLARPEHRYEWLAYTLLVRALRLADQAGTAAGAG